MKQSWFDNNGRLVCPFCHKSEGLIVEWSDSDSIRGEHEELFVCELCNCVFTAVYEIEDIKIIGEGEKK